MYPNSLPQAKSAQRFGRRDREQTEVGVTRGAHFQLAGSDATGNPSTTWNIRVKAPLILLFTRDSDFAQSVREAHRGTAAVVLIARDVRDALQIICERGRELDVALMDFDTGCRGMTLLSAVHTCHPQLPVVVTISDDAEHTTAVAYANGARTCLNKPLRAGTLANAIAELHAEHDHPAAA
ncbi:MAG: Response regulator receiver domain [Verrucomicrobiota bacterium]